MSNSVVSKIYGASIDWAFESSDHALVKTEFTFEEKLSNGYLPANLSNSSTRQKFANFGKFEYWPKWPFLEIFQTRQTQIRQTVTLRSTCQTRIRQTMANLASSASLANLARVD